MQNNTRISAPSQKPKLDILKLRERRLEAARNRETASITNLTNYLIADRSAIQAQTTTATVATTDPAVPATTPLFTTAAEKKIIKRKLPEPLDGGKDSAGKLHRAHSDAMFYHKTLSAILWQIVETVRQQSNPTGATTPSLDVQLVRLVPLAIMEDNMHNYTVGQFFIWVFTTFIRQPMQFA